MLLPLWLFFLAINIADGWAVKSLESLQIRVEIALKMDPVVAVVMNMLTEFSSFKNTHVETHMHTQTH
jgi:hypothetical protein